VQHVRSGGERRIVLEGDGVIDLGENVFGHDPYRAPAIQEVGVEPRIGLRELEDNGVVVLREDVIHPIHHDRVTVEAVVLLEQIHGEHNVFGGEVFAVGPLHSLLERDREHGEVVVVLGVSVRKPGDDLAGCEVDAPQRFVHELLHATVTVLPSNPFVEVGRRSNTAGQHGRYHGLAARQAALGQLLFRCVRDNLCVLAWFLSAAGECQHTGQEQGDEN